MPREFVVPDEFSYSEAMWRSKPGDRILVNSGNLGVAPIKGGVNVEFAPSSTVACLLESVGGQGRSGVKGANRAANVKAFFEFNKLLPFELRLPESSGNPPIRFCSPEGCVLAFIRNVTGQPAGIPRIGSPQHMGDSFAAQRPRALVAITVPSQETVDWAALADGADPAQREKQQKLIRAQTREFGYGQPGVEHKGDILYLAFWTLNRFLRAYGKIAGADKVTREGLSLVEFEDGIMIRVVNPCDQLAFGGMHSLIESYSNVVLRQEQLSAIQDMMVGSADVRLEDHTEIFLERLQYHAATVSMQQSLETLVDAFLDGQGGYKLQAEGLFRPGGKQKASLWHKVIAAPPVANTIPLSDAQQRYLCEMINARNNIAHAGTCEVKKWEKTRKQYENISPMSEYAIYRTKRPWYWYHQLVRPVVECFTKALKASQPVHP